MKKAIFFLCILVLCVLYPLAIYSQEVVVEELRGKVEYRLGSASWRALAVGDRIPVGSDISTGFRSRAVLNLGESTLEVKQLTRMSIEDLVEKEGTVKTELFLRVGRVRADVKRREGLQQEFRLRSPVSTAAVRGTSFGFDGLNLDVDEGRVLVRNRFQQSSSVGAGQQSSSNGYAPPKDAVDLLEQQAVQVSTSQLEEGIQGVLDSGTYDGVEYGWVTVNWELPN